MLVLDKNPCALNFCQCAYQSQFSSKRSSYDWKYYLSSTLKAALAKLRQAAISPTSYHSRGIAHLLSILMLRRTPLVSLVFQSPMQAKLFSMSLSDATVSSIQFLMSSSRRSIRISTLLPLHLISLVLNFFWKTSHSCPLNIGLKIRWMKFAKILTLFWLTALPLWEISSSTPWSRRIWSSHRHLPMTLLLKAFLAS